MPPSQPGRFKHLRPVHSNPRHRTQEKQNKSARGKDKARLVQSVIVAHVLLIGEKREPRQGSDLWPIRKVDDRYQSADRFFWALMVTDLDPPRSSSLIQELRPDRREAVGVGIVVIGDSDDRSQSVDARQLELPEGVKLRLIVALAMATIEEQDGPEQENHPSCETKD